MYARNVEVVFPRATRRRQLGGRGAGRSELGEEGERTSTR